MSRSVGLRNDKHNANLFNPESTAFLIFKVCRLRIKGIFCSPDDRWNLPMKLACWVLPFAAMTTSLNARTLVVTSNGPSAAAYPAGKTLPDPLSITLKAGDRVTLLDGGGTTFLKGPVSISGKLSQALSPEDYAYVSALSRGRPKRKQVAGISFNLDGPTTSEQGRTKGGFTMSRTKSESDADAPRTVVVAAVAKMSKSPEPPSVSKPVAGAPGIASHAKPKASAIAPRTRQPGLWDIEPAVGNDWCVENSSPLIVFRKTANYAIELESVPGGAMRQWPAGSFSQAFRLEPDDNGVLAFRWRFVATARPAAATNTQPTVQPASVLSDYDCADFNECEGDPPDRDWHDVRVSVHEIDGGIKDVRKLATAFSENACDAQLSRLEAIFMAGSVQP